MAIKEVPTTIPMLHVYKSCLTDDLSYRTGPGKRRTLGPASAALAVPNQKCRTVGKVHRLVRYALV